MLHVVKQLFTCTPGVGENSIRRVVIFALENVPGLSIVHSHIGDRGNCKNSSKLASMCFTNTRSTTHRSFSIYRVPELRGWTSGVREGEGIRKVRWVSDIEPWIGCLHKVQDLKRSTTASLRTCRTYHVYAHQLIIPGFTCVSTFLIECRICEKCAMCYCICEEFRVYCEAEVKDRGNL